jgi:AcrR family transcriptional regulator
MELFWARGYEGATLDDLQAAMGGISPPSFYHAFGSKEALFKEVAELYIASVCAPPVRAMEEARTARKGIEAMLRRAVESFTQPGKPRGCLLHTVTKCAPANQGPQTYLQTARQHAPEAIAGRLRRAVAEGDGSPDADLRRIIVYCVTVAHGLAFRAGDGASRAELMTAVDGAMAAWAELVEPQPTSRRPSRQSQRRPARNDRPISTER